MSRMTKFLKQTCTFESAKRDARDKVLHDKFGEVQYLPPVVLKCRKERILREVQTSTGAILRSSTRYFTDESTPIRVDDRFDGNSVLEIEEYVNSLGATEGYESYV